MVRPTPRRVVRKIDGLPTGRPVPTVRLVHLEPSSVVSLMPPESAWIPPDWNHPDRPKLRAAAVAYFVRRLNEVHGFYRALADEMRENGPPWPILATCGDPAFVRTDAVPPEMRPPVRRGPCLWCEIFGGHELFVARRLGLDRIPVLVSDFTTRWHAHREIRTVEEVVGLFRHSPQSAAFGPKGLRIVPPARFSLAGRSFSTAAIENTVAAVLAEIRRAITEGRARDLLPET